jgi:hypothetical protein
MSDDELPPDETAAPVEDDRDEVGGMIGARQLA